MSYINIFITFNDVIKQNEICLVWYVDNVFLKIKKEKTY